MSGIKEHDLNLNGDKEAALFEADDVSVRLGPSPDARLLFSGVDLRIEKGDVVDLVGPSGAGKTTLLCALARMHPYASGTFRLRGMRSDDFTGTHWRTHVALLPQTAAFVVGTVEDNLLIPYTFDEREGQARPSQDVLREMLDGVGLHDIEITRDVHRLSVGQMARVALCRTLLTTPDVLLLDEVDAALDGESVKCIGALVAEYVSQGDRACIRIRHRDYDGFANRRLAFSDGKLIEEVR